MQWYMKKILVKTETLKILVNTCKENGDKEKITDVTKSVDLQLQHKS